MFYFKWTDIDVTGLEENLSIDTLLTEINEKGRVLREIGLNKGGEIVHKCPSKIYPKGTYGYFDNQLVSVSERKSDLTKEEFEELWARPDKNK